MSFSASPFIQLDTVNHHHHHHHSNRERELYYKDPTFIIIKAWVPSSNEAPLHPHQLDQVPLHPGEPRCQHCPHRVHHVDSTCAGAVQNMHQTCVCSSKCGAGPHCGRICGSHFTERKAVIRNHKSELVDILKVCECSACSCARCRPVIDCGCSNCGCPECMRKKGNRKVAGIILLVITVLCFLAAIAIAVVGFTTSKMMIIPGAVLVLFPACITAGLGICCLKKGTNPSSKFHSWRS